MWKKLSLILVCVILGSVTVAFSAGLKTKIEPSKLELKDPKKLTAKELKTLYEKYNISDNDIKFAKGQLPYYLEGYLPDSYVVMGRTANGTVEDWIDPKAVEHFRKIGVAVLNASEFLAIREKARKAFIEKYGVDPHNPRVVMVDGIPVPKEYAKELAEKYAGDYLDGGLSQDFKPQQFEIMSSKAASGPQIKNGALYLWIVEAIGDDRPTNTDYFDATLDAYDRFQVFNSGATLNWYFLDFWDASDVTSGKLSDYLEDLAEDMEGWRSWYNDGDPQNDIMIGWIKSVDDKYCGYAYINGFYSVGVTESGHYTCWLIPLDIVAQHEISHNFKAEDSTYCWEHDPCIMNYCWVTLGTNTWCDLCWDRIYNNINGISDE
ncbi:MULTISPECIES: hypothetical protein [unclassified Archaeoglobus]|jgi:hypothetical protein|uniref:hypothetical protein n=1 Tax=unclassified Archaeoglobus TaxID=2643606 RepID=UPI0025B8DA18|nr:MULTISPECIES: hypothetical protein [unclassified Archaeoglobus]